MEHKYKLINECIICLESNDTTNPILKLNTFKKPCNCDSYIHKKCLLKWYTYNAICPVCRISINTLIEENELPLYNTFEDRNDCTNSILFKCCCYLIICIIVGIYLNF